MDSKSHIDEKITLRLGLLRDTYSCFKIAAEAFFDFNYRSGQSESSAPPQLSDYNRMWGDFESLYSHLQDTGEYFWVAASADELIGYARSTLRDGVLELTDFFI